jgi:hypothetical protein
VRLALEPVITDERHLARRLMSEHDARPAARQTLISKLELPAQTSTPNSPAIALFVLLHRYLIDAAKRRTGAGRFWERRQRQTFAE